MKYIILLVSLFSLVGSQAAWAIETTAKQAFLIDTATHSVLLNKDGEVQMHPSSMSKLMTVYILFSRLKEGRVKLDSAFHVSEKAWRTQGSKTFVGIGSEIKVEDLINGIIIQSGNDACVVVAEGISGTEDAFVNEMNQTATKLGLTHSHFTNANGLPNEHHLMSARDLATLAERLIVDFPEYYHYFSTKEYTYNNITQQNRNRLLTRSMGVDGLKTGHTDDGGYGITLSAKQGDRRLILVINGLTTDKERIEEGDSLLRWGFREFENKTLVHKEQKVLDAEVWFGTSATVPLIASEEVLATLPAGEKKGITFTVKYNSPLPAPIEKGAHVADLIIKTPDGDPKVVPLVAGQGVDKLSGVPKVAAVLAYYLHGKK